MTAVLAHVVAVSQNGVIGSKGGMPWRLSSDLKRFRALTMGKPMIMGRKTFASIGKVLDGRDTVIVTRDAGFAASGATICISVEDAVATARQYAKKRGVEEIAVVGGGEIYAATLSRTKRIYLTRVMANIEGDTYYPALDPVQWREVSREEVSRGERDNYDTVYSVLERV